MKNRLKELREERKLYQKDLAKYLNVAVSTYSYWEKGTYEPDQNVLAKLADYFDVSIDYLLGRDEISPSNEIPFDFNFINLPVIASIAAGYDHQAVEEITGEWQPVPTMMTRGYRKEELLVLSVKGDSMYPDFHDGDRVLVHRQESVDSGDIAVILYNEDEATIKKVRYESGQAWMELIPRNPEYKTKRIEGYDLQFCRVIGKVIYLFRNI